MSYSRAAEAPKPAIVLAAFGAAEPAALTAILNIARRFRAAFPEREVFLAFTSGFVRRAWRRRAGDREFRDRFPEIPEEIYGILSPLGVLAALAEDGPRPVAVQSLHVAAGAEFQDLAAVVRQLAGIATVKPAQRPFPELSLGLPALGDGGEGHLWRAAEALAPLARLAEAQGAALVLVGHGPERPDQPVYRDLEKTLRARYGRPMYVGLVEGGPGQAEVLAALAADRPAKVLLALLMVVAGAHAQNDLAGDGPQSWAGVLRAAGYEVAVHLQGLGSLESWADLYLTNLRAAEVDLVSI